MKRLGRLGRVVRKGSHKERVKELDSLARDATFARDGYKCQRCGKSVGIQWCHVHSRRYLSTRHDLDNCLTLCAGDHLWWHHRPVEAVGWWQETWPQRATRLALVRQTGRKVDLAALKLYLTEQINGGIR